MRGSSVRLKLGSGLRFFPELADKAVSPGSRSRSANSDQKRTDPTPRPEFVSRPTQNNLWAVPIIGRGFNGSVMCHLSSVNRA